MLGKTLAELGVADAARPTHVSVKESVFPFAKFPGVDLQLGPEMRSTGEVMGVGTTLAEAFGKAQLASSVVLPLRGTALITVKDGDKPVACAVAKKLVELGFTILATSGTRQALADAGIESELVGRVRDGSPHVVDAIREGRVNLVVNTTVGAKAIRDSYSIRRQSLLSNVPLITTMPGAVAFVDAIQFRRDNGVTVRSLQEWHGPSRPL
jgi:carbamoyl-phosphate synthase large subunit